MRARAARAMSSSTASRRKPCIPQTDKLEGKHIVTVEGLSDFEKEAFTYAFGEAGAVQCGFCIPGMVISAKGLIDQNPDPTREEAAFAIRNNICRCTGYVKIIDGILLAAKILREGKIPEKKEDFRLARACTVSTSPKRYRATASTPMTSMLTACAMAARCAASTRAPACSISARKRRKRFLASSVC